MEPTGIHRANALGWRTLSGLLHRELLAAAAIIYCLGVVVGDWWQRRVSRR